MRFIPLMLCLVALIGTVGCNSTTRHKTIHEDITTIESPRADQTTQPDKYSLPRKRIVITEEQRSEPVIIVE